MSLRHISSPMHSLGMSIMNNKRKSRKLPRFQPLQMFPPSVITERITSGFDLVLFAGTYSDTGHCFGQGPLDAVICSHAPQPTYREGLGLTGNDDFSSFSALL